MPGLLKYFFVRMADSYINQYLGCPPDGGKNLPVIEESRGKEKDSFVMVKHPSKNGITEVGNATAGG